MVIDLRETNPRFLYFWTSTDNISDTVSLTKMAAIHPIRVPMGSLEMGRV